MLKNSGIIAGCKQLFRNYHKMRLLLRLPVQNESQSSIDEKLYTCSLAAARNERLLPIYNQKILM